MTLFQAVVSLLALNNTNIMRNTIKRNTLITCDLSANAGRPRSFSVKKVCPISEMPKNARYYYTCYFNNGSTQDIYLTESGVLYAKPVKF